MYEYWHAYTKPKHGYKTKLCYMDMDIFIVQVKSQDVYLDFSYDETKFDTPN